MKSHRIRQILAQVPSTYPVIVKQGDTEIEVADISFSHQPQQVLIRLAAPAKLPEPEATIEELNTHAATFVTRSHGDTNHDGTPVPPAGPADNPAVLAKSLGDDAVLPVVGELDAGEVQHARTHPEEVEKPATPSIGEQVIAAAKAKKTRKVPIDLQILAEELRTSRQLDEIGGYAYLTQVSSRIPTTAQSNYFIEKVRELHVLREVIKTATGTVESCYAYDGGGLSEFVERVQGDIYTVTQGSAPLSERLAESRVRHDKPPVEAKAMLSIARKPVSTQGNLTAIIAQAKAGKTTLVGGALTAILVADGYAKPGADTLGWQAVPTKGRVVIYFDTELSPHDHWTALDRVVRRAGCTTMPEWLQNHCVTGWQATEIRAGLRTAIESTLRKGKEIYAIILDGVADLCADVNDAEESNSLVSELHSLAIQASTPVICVMHRNEGDKADSAARGHLGKQLARKAETNLRLEQKEDISFVFADRNRGAPIKQDEGPAFKWDANCFMHKSISADEKAQFHRDHADDDKKPSRSKREPREPSDASREKWNDSEVLALFPFGEKAALPLPQIMKMAESRLGMKSGVFATFRFNLLTDGKIRMSPDGLYYK